MTELGVVRRKVKRAERAAVDALAPIRRRDRARGDGPRRAHEALHAADLPGRLVSGTAVTVLLHPGDNWMMHVAAEQIEPGDIVVAAITADCTDGYFGDLLATSFRARGAQGALSSTPACAT